MSRRYTVFSPEEAAQHRDAMMHAEFDEKSAAMRGWGATEEEIAAARADAVRLRHATPFHRWITAKAKTRL